MRKRLRPVMLIALMPIVASASIAPLVRAPAGGFRGTGLDGVDVFLGIPFALPPVGPRRWRAPQPVAESRGTRMATMVGPDCVQERADDVSSSYTNRESEDCLYLNIWRPRGGLRSEGRALPVMVWIHGGAFIQGSGSLPIYDGTALARHGVIVVTINYRLGRFGTFALPALSREQAGAAIGNYGLMDQIAALRWIVRNIAAFGGDPANVTIAGQSAGASSVNFLMSSPLARGLFAKAISESGGDIADLAPLTGGVDSAEAQGLRWARRKGIDPDDLAALRKLPASAVLDAPVLSPAYPIVDGRIVPAPIKDAFRAGWAATIPYLVGTNGFEGSLLRWLPGAEAKMMTALGARAEADLAMYAQPGDDRTTAIARMWGDYSETIPSLARARQLTAAGAPVWFYRFDYVPQAQRGKVKGAGHGDEIEMVFDAPSLRPPPGWAAADGAMSGLIGGYWLAFIKTGNPNHPGAPAWPSFGGPKSPLMLFDDHGAEAVTQAEAAPLDALTRDTAGTPWGGAYR